MPWQTYTSNERLGAVASGLALGWSQAEIGRKHGTTNNAIAGFINRNAEALGKVRAAPEPPPPYADSKNKRREPASYWTEAKLTEKWVAKAREVTQPVTPPGRPSLLTEDDKRYVTRLYKDGTKIAVIAAELDVSEKTVKNEVSNQQRAGILKTRRPALGGNILFRLQLDKELNQKVYAGAKRRGSTKADYIRMLIRRDNP